MLLSVATAADFDANLPGFYAPEAIEPGPLRGAARAVVSIGGSSGFFVSPDGLILTNAHVADVAGEVARIRPAWDSLVTLRAERIWVSEALDMALYQADSDEPTPYAPLRHAPPVAGEAVAVVGHPDGRPLRIAFGQIIDDDAFADGRPAVTYDAVTGWGSSGSPVIDARGQVVAVHRAWGWGPGFEGNFIGVPSDVLIAAMEAWEEAR